MKSFASLLALALALSSIFFAHSSAAQSSPEDVAFVKLLNIFDAPRIVGDCKIRYTGNEDGSVDLLFQKPYKQNPTPSALQMTPPYMTGGRTIVEEEKAGKISYKEADAVGWIVMDVYTNKQNRPSYVSITKQTALGKVYKTDIECGKKPAQ